MKKVTKKSNQNLSPLQQQWKEMIERQIGKSVGVKVYNPFLKDYIYPVHNEGSIRCLLEMIPSDNVIRQYIQKVQNNQINNQ